jgi:hypothetical protein
LLSLFGIQPDDALMPEHGPPSSTQSFDVTALVQAAMADPTLRGRLAATFVPQVLGAAPTSPGPWATARRVALSAG